MPATQQSRHLFRVLVTLALVSACGDTATAPEPITPGRLEAAALPAQATVGSTITSPTVTLRDTRGRPLAGAVVSFELLGGGGSIERQTSVTGPDGSVSPGAWVLGTRPGTNTLEARATGVAPVQLEVVAGVGAAAALVAGTSGALRGVVGRPIEPELSIIVRDAFGNLVPGATVSFAAGSGCGQVAQSSALTDTAGVARAAWTLGPGAGPQTLQASLGTLGLTLTAEALPGAPATAQPVTPTEQAGTVGQPVTTPPAVQVKDEFGNPVPGIAVVLVVAEGSGQVAGGTPVTDASGTARATSWTLGPRAGGNRLTATVTGLQPVVFTATAAPGPVAALTRIAGDGQTAAAGFLLPLAPAVAATDSYGNPVAGVEVTFTAASGTVTGGTARTDSAGVARVGGWRLGSTAGPQALEARAGQVAASFTATAVAGPPAVLQVVGGQAQSGTVGSLLPVPPAVRVRDALGNDVAGAEVRFAVTAGGGAVTGAAPVTGSDGVAAVGGWTLGVTPGANRLSASVTGAGSVTFTATAVVGPAARMVKTAGDAQSAQVGTAVAIRPTVRITDRYGNPVAGVGVSFQASPGGTITGEAQVTGADGTASVGAWVLAAVPGANTLAAASAGLGSVTFTASGVSAPPPPAAAFRIELRYLTAVTEVQRQAFEHAATRWQQVITGDLPSGTLQIGAGACGTGSPALDETIDDLLVFVTVEPIDGLGSVLASAGPCYIRGSGSLPILGRMRFDTADLASLEQSGRLADVVLHELGHVLGFGTIWQLTGTLAGAGTADPFFTGPAARQRFLLAGGSSPPGYGVPVENSGGAGTRDSHWLETGLRTELMTGWISAAGTPNPLSAITIASLADLGYTVNLAAADPYAVPAAAGYQLDEPLIRLLEEPLPPPRVVR